MAKKYNYFKNDKGMWECGHCGYELGSQSGISNHCRKKHKEDVEEGRSEQEERKSDAKVRRLKRIIRNQSKQLEIIDRIVDIVSDSIMEIPDISTPNLPDYTTGNDETVLLLLSDAHVGKKTKSYNLEVFQKRLKTLWEGMMSIVSDRRTSRPLKKIVIVFNGDIVDAESIYPGQSVEGIEVPLVHQIFTNALPRFTEFLSMCLENFEEVEVICNMGNHGRQNQAKWTSAKSSNWDVMFYKALEAMFQEEDRIEFDIALKDYKRLFEIEGHGFMATHGNMIRSYYNLPFYGATRQAQRWQANFRDEIKLSYFLFGHFHSPGYMTFNQAQIVFNGSFVTDDKFAEEKLGVSSDPKQMLMGVHPKYGVSWRYALDLIGR